MKQKLACAMIAAFAITCSGNVFADVDGDRSHQGRISIGGTIRPGPCKIFIDGGGHVDFGEISAGRLNENSETELEQKKLRFSVQCTGRTAVAISSNDDLTATNPFKYEEEGESESSGALASLNGVLEVTDKGSAAGVYAIRVDGVHTITETGKEIALKTIWRDHPGAPWSANEPGILNVGGRQLSWSEDGETPATASEFYGDFVVWPFIRPSKHLDLTRALEFKGQSTITLTY